MIAPPAFERRNFWVHSLEGGLYMGGLAFLSAESVMPAMVHSLGGSAFLVALMPALLVIGFVSPVIFTVPLLARLHRYKPLVVATGILQRLPYLFAGLALYFPTDIDPAWTLAIVVCAPLLSGLTGGTTINAWLEMITRMIPREKRAPAWAIRFILSGLIGIAAGPVILHILATHPGTKGYAALHFIAFGFLTLSMLIFLFLKETDFPQPKPGGDGGYFREIARIPALARSVPGFRRFLCVRFTGVSLFIIAPFLALHALAVTGRSEQDVGYFVAAQMSGSILGNVLAALIGNRRGGKAAMALARALVILLCVFLMANSSFTGFVAGFFVFGFSMFLDRVGDLTLGVEICPRENRPSLMALLTFIHAPAMLAAAAVATVIQKVSADFHLAALTGAGLSLFSLILLWNVEEPRRPAERVAPLGVSRR